MALVKRLTKGSPLTFAEGDANLVYLESLALSGSANINTSSFATTGSNTFTGNQSITNSTLRLSAGSSIVWTGSAILNDWDYAPLINANSSKFIISPQGTFASSANTIYINMSGSLGIGKMPTASLDVNGNLALSQSITISGQSIYVDNNGLTLAGTGLNLYSTTGTVNISSNSLSVVSGNITTNTVYGNLSGTASFATTASYIITAQTASYVKTAQTASYVLTAQTASYYNTNALATTGSNSFNGNQTITGSFIQSGSFTSIGPSTFTGSVVGNVTALSIASNTASLDLSLGSFYTLQLVQGTNTYINPSNIKSGETVSLLVSTTGSATVSFPSIVLQPSGSSYTPTTTTGKDVLTFISFDTTNLYLASVKNLI